MVRTLSIQDFLQKAEHCALIDVRTPAEFEYGHIPGAHNLPLFTNEERVVIGTLYKQQGREPAILKGLEFVGPRMRSIVEEAEAYRNGREILVHCWRGGMRSGSVAWLLDTYGMPVSSLRGGYKSFRRWVLEQFALPRQLLILGGKTGSGKTRILQALRERQEQVVDLEGLAHHKGSAFGAIGELPQPTQEQFENRLAMALSHTDPGKVLWLEDESRMIGKKVIPDPLWLQMRAAPVIFMDIPAERRIPYLVQEYGRYPEEELAASIERLTRRMGGLATQQAILALQEGNLAETARILLEYYDKTYLHGLHKRPDEQIFRYMPDAEHAEGIAAELCNFAAEIPEKWNQLS